MSIVSACICSAPHFSFRSPSLSNKLEGYANKSRFSDPCHHSSPHFVREHESLESASWYQLGFNQSSGTSRKYSEEMYCKKLVYAIVEESAGQASKKEHAGTLGCKLKLLSTGGTSFSSGKLQLCF